MLLAIDAGNTQTTIGLFQGSQLLSDWRLRTDRGHTADELEASLHALFALRGRSLRDVTAVVIASVVPSANLAMTSFCQEHLNISPHYVRADSAPGMAIRTRFPDEVGADRIVNALAARELYGFPAVIVDFGTAITFDCLDASGDYIGGIILPGMALAVDALAARTAKLPRVDLAQPPDKAIGDDTVSAIRSGVLFGYGAMIEGLLARVKEEMSPPEPTVIATGGMARLLPPYAPSIANIDQRLTLIGLRLYHHAVCR